MSQILRVEPRHRAPRRADAHSRAKHMTRSSWTKPDCPACNPGRHRADD